MTDGQAIHTAILADPADDLARLAYADWLEENGRDARAEFIRVQLAYARREKGSVNAASRYFQERRWGPMLLGELPQGWQPQPDRPGVWNEPTPAAIYARGFVSLVRCRLQHWLDHGRAFAAAHPIERVELTDKKPHARFMMEEQDSLGAGWQRAVWANFEYEIDPELWGALPASTARTRFQHLSGWVVYADEQAAKDALSSACIAWARSQP